METDPIARIVVPAAADAVLYLWATVLMIEHALAVPPGATMQQRTM
jgi:hypothetical protein